MGIRRPQPRSQRPVRQEIEVSQAGGAREAFRASQAAQTVEASQAAQAGEGPQAAEAVKAHESAQGSRASGAAEAHNGPGPGPWSGSGSGSGSGSLEEVAAVKRIGVCPVCGETFDPARYQILVSALDNAAFDRIECADEALATRRWTKRGARRRRDRLEAL